MSVLNTVPKYSENKDYVKKAVELVRSNLKESDRKPEYRNHPNPMAGHCYVASQALWFMLGGPKSNWVPHAVNYPAGAGYTHRFLKHKVTGEVLDPTHDQFDPPITPDVYEKGRPLIYMSTATRPQGTPDKRASIVLERIWGGQKLQGLPKGTKLNAPKPEPEIPRPMRKAEFTKDPIQIASVAVFNKDGKMLWGERKDSGKWTMPGGHFEANESGHKAAVRELYEEAGLKPDEMEYLGQEGITSPEGDDLMIHAYKAVCSGTPTTENDPDDEVDEWYWIDVKDGLPDEIAEHLHAPKNVTLKLLDLQEWGNDELVKADGGLKATPKPKLPRKPKAVKPPEEKNLAVMHNLTAGNFLHADELGGLPAPSLGIVNVNHGMEGFGEVSLLGPHSMVDPALGNKTFAADIYSPRWPNSKVKIKPKEYTNFVKWLKPHAAMADTYISNLEDDFEKKGAEGLIGDRTFRPAMQLAYLKERGEDIKVPMRKKHLRVSISGQPAMREFFAREMQNPEYGGEGPRMAWHLMRNDLLKDHEPSPLMHRLSAAAKEALHQHIGEIISKGNGLDETDRQSLIELHSKDLFDEDNPNVLSYGPADRLLADYEHYDKEEPDKYALEDMLKQRINQLGNENFEKWALDKMRPIEGGRYISKWNPNTGNERKIPYNLENVLKELTRKVRQGEDFNYGLGTARAAGAKQFKSLDDIAKARSKIVSHEDFQKLKDVNDKRFGDLADELRRYNVHDTTGFNTLENLSEAIGESYKRGRSLWMELDKSGFKNVPMHLRQRVADFAADLLAMPTEYFESKPQRVVYLNEFRGAAVPHNVDPKVLEALNRHGISHVERYDPNVQGNRNEAIKRIAQAQNLLLSESEWALDKSEHGDRLVKMVGHLTFPHFGVGRPHTEPLGLVPGQEAVRDRMQQGSDLKGADNVGAMFTNALPKKANPAPIAHGFVLIPPEQEELQDHETQHSVFNKVADIHGFNVARKLTHFLHNGLENHEKWILNDIAKASGYKPDEPYYHEEMLTNLQTFLNSPKKRRSFFAKNARQYRTLGERREFQTQAKQLWRKLMEKAQNASPEDLHGIKLAKSETVVNGDVKRMLGDFNVGNRLMALKLPGVTKDDLKQALVDSDPRVRHAALHHEQMSNTLLLLSLFDDDTKVQLAAIAHPLARPEQLEDLLEHPSAEIRAAVARRDILKGDQTRRMMGDPKNDRDIKTLVLDNQTSVPDDVLNEIISRAEQTKDEDDIFLAQKALEHDNAPQSAIDRFVGQDAPVSLRIVAIQTGRASVGALEQLFSDYLAPSELKVDALKYCENLTPELVQQALRDQDPRVREAAAQWEPLPPEGM